MLNDFQKKYSGNEERLSSELEGFNTKLLLVNPPQSPISHLSQNSNNWYPYSLLFLISYLYKNGYRNGKILDLSVTKDTKEELEKYLKDNKFEVIGFTSTTENRFLVLELIKSAKKAAPKAKIIVGGDHFTYTAKEALKAIPEIDIVVRGEGELILSELIKAFERKKSFSNILGITYRKGKKIIENLDHPLEHDLDKLNIEESASKFIVIPKGNYSPFRIMRNYEREKLKALYIHAGRGCPGRCVYCLYNKKKYRTRSVESILKEIKEKIKKYNCNVFYLHDPFLLKNKDFVIKFCNRILKENINVKWYAESRLDVDVSLIPLMKKAGCISMDFGLESCSPRVIEAIRKGINMAQAQRIIDVCKKQGIKIKLFTMISLPEETEKDALETLGFLRKNKKFIATFSKSITRIYPGSELEAMAKEKGILDKNFDWYDGTYKNPIANLMEVKYAQTPVWLENLSPEFIQRILLKYSELEKTKEPFFVPFEVIWDYIFDWKNETLAIKINRAKNYLKIISLKLGYSSKI